MDFFGILAFLVVMFNMSLPGRITGLNSDIRMLKHRIKGGNTMSEILKELEGKRCKLTLEESSLPIECDVISVDTDWMKIIHYEKNNKTTTKIIKIEQINEVALV